MDRFAFHLLNLLLLAMSLSFLDAQKTLTPSSNSQSLFSNSIVSLEPTISISLTTLNFEPSIPSFPSMSTLSSIQTGLDTSCALSQTSVIPLCLREKPSASLACYLLEDLITFNTNGVCKAPFNIEVRNCTRSKSSSKSILSSSIGTNSAISRDVVKNCENNTVGLEYKNSSNHACTQQLNAATENMTQVLATTKNKHRRHEFSDYTTVTRDLGGTSKRIYQSLFQLPRRQRRKLKGKRLPRKVNVKREWKRKKSKSTSQISFRPYKSQVPNPKMVPSLNVAEKRYPKTQAKRIPSSKGKKGNSSPLGIQPTRLGTQNSMMKGKNKKNSNQNVRDQDKKKKKRKGKGTTNPTTTNGKYPNYSPPIPKITKKPTAVPAAPVSGVPFPPPQIRMTLLEADCDVPCVLNDAKDRVCFGASTQGYAVAVTTISYIVSDASGVSKLFQLDVVITDDPICAVPISTCRVAP
jgi:type 1 fimbria pilin